MDREEIIELALQYIDECELVDFPEKDELFCFMQREIPEFNLLDDEVGWTFGGYGLCTGYEKDYESKPAGKWIWFHYLTLNGFPPSPQVTKLQPPHIAKGLFTNPSRTVQMRILKMMPDTILKRATEDAKNSDNNSSGKDNLLAFPGTKK